MRNPFNEMVRYSKVADVMWEDIEDSTLQCQEKGCWEIVKTGRYNDSEQLLTWKCSKGHISKANMKL